MYSKRRCVLFLIRRFNTTDDIFMAVHTAIEYSILLVIISARKLHSFRLYAVAIE